MMRTEKMYPYVNPSSKSKYRAGNTISKHLQSTQHATNNITSNIDRFQESFGLFRDADRSAVTSTRLPINDNNHSRAEIEKQIGDIGINRD